MKKKNTNDNIGIATMREDKTIILHLRAEDQGDTIGDAYFEYPQNHAQYKMILEHIGKIETGESKPVPPWPETL